jgi:cytochrome oxidase assembly protein ShyY1
VIRRLPLVPTLIVGAAIAVMIALGVWQLGRAKEKDSLLAQYRAAEGLPPIAFPATPLGDDQLPLFRHATAMCLQPVAKRATAGRNRAGETGYAHIVDCRTGFEGPGVSIELGWSRDPKAQFDWRGGPVSGVIAPDRRSRMRLVAASAPEGLAPSAPPSLETIPNNHRSYAVQWFLFAVIAAAIYALAVRKRLKPEAPPQ